MDSWRVRWQADRLCVMGPVMLFSDGRERQAAGIPGGIVRLLCCSTDRWVSIDELVDAVWDGAPPPTARSAIHVHLGSVRRWLGFGELVLEKSSAGYRLDLGDVEADWSLMFDLFRQAHILAASVPDEALYILRCALSLPRGPLVGPASGNAAIQSLSQRVESAQLAAQEDLVEALLRAGSYLAAEAEATRLVEQSPFRELRWVQLMRARYLDNRPHDALQAYKSARKLFVEELGSEPGPALQGLQRAVLMHDLGAIGPPRREARTFTSPPPTAGDLIGRESELARSVEALAAYSTVAITGPPGVGKTRLAGEICRRITDPTGSVAWVDLCEHDNPARALAVAIGAAPDSDESDLIRLLFGQRVLIVFDNAEHLVSAVEQVVVRLNRELPDSRIVVTSRLRPFSSGSLPVLHLELQPLPAPTQGASDDSFEANASVELLRCSLHELAPAVSLSRDEVVSICELSGGLPLAIRLAAGRLRSVGADTRVSLIGKNVGATYAPMVMATLSLLPESRQPVYETLAILPGRFDVELGAALTGLSIEEFTPVIVDLVDCGLVDVVPGPPASYRILPPLRDAIAYGLLDAEFRRSALDRLVDHEISRAQALARKLREGVPGEDIEAAVVAEIGSVSLAMDHLIVVGDAERALELAGRLDPILYSIGWWTEKNRLLDQALALEGPPTVLRARALTMRARSGLLSQFDIRMLREAEVIANDLGADMLVAYASHLLGIGLWWRGEVKPSLTMSRSAVTSFRRAGRTLEELEARKFVGLALLTSGQHDAGIQVQQDVLAGFERLGIDFHVAHSLGYLGHSHRYLGDDIAAEVDLRNALEICRRIQNRGTAIHVHLGLGDIAADQGDSDTAIEHASDALGLISRSRLHAYEPWAWTLSMRSLEATGDIERALGCGQQALAALHFAPAGDQARLALEFAAIALRLEDSKSAARLVGAAEHRSGPREMPLPSAFDRQRHLEVIEQVERAVGIEGDRHIAQGRRCTVAEAAGRLLEWSIHHSE